MLTELEEIVVYKQSYDDPQKQSLIKQTWNKRYYKLTKDSKDVREMLKFGREYCE